MRFLKLFITILLIGSQHFVFAQDTKKHRSEIVIETRVHYGVVLPFYDAIKYLVYDNAYGFELLAVFPTYGRDYWDKLFRYPRTGFGYSAWNLGNREVFGRAHALYGFFNPKLISLKEKFTLNYLISFGISYLTKPFDIERNYLNRAIGSHANVYFRIGIDSRIRLFSRYEVVAEAGFSHFSNGKYKSPNYGLNALTASLGINYHFGDLKQPVLDPDLPLLTKRIHQSVIYSAGTKVYDNILGIRYFVSSLTYDFDWSWKHKRLLGLGADLFYDESISEALAVDGIKNTNKLNRFRFGIHGSHTLQYRKLMLSLQLGYYLYSKYTDLTLVYSRIALKYLLNDHYVVNLALKSHLAKADFIEWGIGYHW